MAEIKTSAEQGSAIKQILNWYNNDNKQEFYLAGYAGVGKSTIANIAIEDIKEKHGIEKVYTAAYTGKAASILRKKGISKAQTVHSLIYEATVNEKTGAVSFELSDKSKAAKAQLIVLDECSMIDDQMANDLRSFGKKILIMGDPAQLPPVGGQGAFTRSKPDAFLREIHRQALDSPILELATRVRQGKPLPEHYEKGNVSVMPLTKDSADLTRLSSTQVICGLNRVRWKCTQDIRKQLGHEGHHPLKGERLICCKNNRNMKLFNGMMGVLKDLKCDFKNAQGMYEIDVQMEDDNDIKTTIQIDPYHFNNHFTGGESKKLNIPGKFPDEFDWGYVITCHKAQGSSWEHVTIIDDSKSFKESCDKWLYTAITRAETGLTLLTRKN